MVSTPPQIEGPPLWMFLTPSLSLRCYTAKFEVGEIHFLSEKYLMMITKTLDILIITITSFRFIVNIVGAN